MEWSHLEVSWDPRDPRDYRTEESRRGMAERCMDLASLRRSVVNSLRIGLLEDDPYPTAIQMSTRAMRWESDGLTEHLRGRPLTL